MTDVQRPVVLVVDDHADVERTALKKWKDRLDLRVRHPNDVIHDDIRDADLIVVDFIINDWPERDRLSTLALKPPDGLALAAILRGHSNEISESPTAFLLRSAHLEKLSNGLPPESRLHIIAQQYNLEWAQPKGGDVNEHSQQIESLAIATKALPAYWPVDDAAESRRLVAEWLRIPKDANWNQLAWQDVEECHPPLHHMTDRRRGLRFLRWFLHRVLPYPCFLWTNARLAARLRVTQESLNAALDSGLDQLFEETMYTGQLRGFFGLRWWRSGIEATLWKVTEGRSFDPSITQDTLNQHCGGALQPLPFVQPVVCVTSDYEMSEEIINVEEAIRIQPDEWPTYADQAWVPIREAFQNERLRAVVVTDDRYRVEDAEEEEPA